MVPWDRDAATLHAPCGPDGTDTSRDAGTRLWRTKNNPELLSQSCELSNFL